MRKGREEEGGGARLLLLLLLLLLGGVLEEAADGGVHVLLDLLLLLGQLLLGRVLDDEGVELVPRVHLGLGPARLALHRDEVPLDLHDRLGVAASVALDELLDEALEVLDEHLVRVRAVHDRCARLLVVARLGPQLAAEVLEHVLGGAGEGLGDVDVVHDGGANAVPAALHLGLELGHLVPAGRGRGAKVEGGQGTRGCPRRSGRVGAGAGAGGEGACGLIGRRRPLPPCQVRPSAVERDARGG